jgi:hypothetical protein
MKDCWYPEVEYTPYRLTAEDIYGHEYSGRLQAQGTQRPLEADLMLI